MEELINILKCNDVKKQIDGIACVIERLRSGSNEKNAINDEDILLIIKCLDSINDARLWNSIWTVLLLLPKNDSLIKYCEKALDENNESPKQALLQKRPDYLLNYLFKYDQEEREELLKKFLNSKDITLRFAAAEELANTELTKALIIMMDIYESAIHTYEHDIVDAIDSWICYEGDINILCELERRMNTSEDNILKTKYNYWKQGIESKSR